MQNYYEILGLTSKANLSEIKIAFRKLAKLYHPDKNPNGKELFNQILRAYETLSNPTLKSSYDYKITYYQHQTASYTKSHEKKTTFTEQELKRRQYYDEHIKKHAKKYQHQNVEQLVKSNYNEFKYVLLATPIAVIIFLLIVTWATPDRKQINTITTKQLITNDSIKKQQPN